MDCMSEKRNRMRLEGRCSVEAHPLLGQIADALEKEGGGSVAHGFILETAVRLLAEVMGIPVPMGPKKNEHPMMLDVKEYVKARAVEHLDRVITLYDNDRFTASQKGGLSKAANLRDGAEP